MAKKTHGTFSTRSGTGATRPERAFQAWIILVGMPMRRETTTYGQLGRHMFRKKAPGVNDKTLGHIAHYCDDHGLPQLNALCVNETTGAPGASIPLAAHEVHEEREKIYKIDWYNIRPPSPEDFKAASHKHFP